MLFCCCAFGSVSHCIIKFGASFSCGADGLTFATKRHLLMKGFMVDSRGCKTIIQNLFRRVKLMCDLPGFPCNCYSDVKNGCLYIS